jgi:ribosomal-protein-alanine N-acetyltransferase
MKQLNTSVFDSFPILKTTRLTLREIRISDAPRIFAMRASDRINQFIARPDMQQEEAAFSLAERTIHAFHNKQSIAWAGILREHNEIIGTCGFNSIDAANLHAEIGGEMSTEYWGKNIALEAVRAILHFGFHTLNLHSIEAKVSPENRSAIYILEQLGFTREALFKDRIYYNGKFLAMVVYALIQGNEKLT